MTTESEVSKWSGESEKCDPGIFTTIPSQPETLKPGQLLPQQIQQYFEEHLRALLSNDRLLNLAEQLLDTSDIQAHPVWSLRTKTPQNEATTVPWHQDAAYLDNDAYKVHQVTAWIPLLDADETNGCLQMIRGGHRLGKVAKHQCCHGGTWYLMVEEDEMEKTLAVDMKRDLVTCPVPYGGLLLFNNMIPHRSLNNQSDRVRWSLDLRWQSSKQPVGFYGLKQGLVMRSSTDPHLNIDWDTFEGVDRHKEAAKALEQATQELDTSYPGPWMKKWEIVHVNRHVEAMLQDSGKVHSWHGIKA